MLYIMRTSGSHSGEPLREHELRRSHGDDVPEMVVQLHDRGIHGQALVGHMLAELTTLMRYTEVRVRAVAQTDDHKLS